MSAADASLPSNAPWRAMYTPELDPEPELEHPTILAAWQSRLARAPMQPAIKYFDGVLTVRQADELSNALAAGLAHRHDVKVGDRVGIYLQNVPHYPITLFALWKIGAVAVPLNPMYKGRELRSLVDDAGAVGVIASATDVDRLRQDLAGSTIRFVIGAHDRDFQTRDDPRVFGVDPVRTTARDDDITELMEAGRDLPAPPPPSVTGRDTAFITYTSGTTGPPKGALNSHANFLHSVNNLARWVNVESGDVVLAIAPLFHITGLSLNAGVALLNDAVLVLTNRFQASVVIDAIREHEVTFTIGAITAFNALFEVPSASREDFKSVKFFYSGGAPIPPTTLARFQARFGIYLHNVWGMTETTGGGIAVPAGINAPIHEPSGTLSIGVPMQNVAVRVLDDDGLALGSGEPGELEVAAPQVVTGYWGKPAETAATFPGGSLRTGDVVIIDDQGWIYLVDRLKDMIIASGFKVWPREVEDVFYEHPAVFEAAVVGEPDDYRGETVVAYVSLADGRAVTEEELFDFARGRLAAYKYPRRVHIVDALPKTATGKIRRRAVREARES